MQRTLIRGNRYAPLRQTKAQTQTPQAPETALNMAGGNGPQRKPLRDVAAQFDGAQRVDSAQASASQRRGAQAQKRDPSGRFSK